MHDRRRRHFHSSCPPLEVSLVVPSCSSRRAFVHAVLRCVGVQDSACTQTTRGCATTPSGGLDSPKLGIDVSLSPDQMAMRRGAITASDVAAVLGLNPYRAQIDVWAWMVHGYRVSDNEYMAWGRALEPVIREWIEAKHGIRLWVPGTIFAPDNARHAATPDAMSDDEGFEIKVHGAYARGAYGEPGSDDVPEHELLQCVWGMRCTGKPSWRLVVSLGAPPLEYSIPRDHDLERDVCEAVDDWLARYVDTRTPPPPDGSVAYDAWIARLRRGRSDREELALEVVEAEVAQLRRAHRESITSQRKESVARQALQLAMGSATDIVTPDGRITWRPRNDGVRVFRTPKSWKDVE